MIDKISNLLSSIRFWQLVIGAVLLILADYGIIPAQIAEVIAALFGVSVVVGTADKVLKK